MTSNIESISKRISKCSNVVLHEYSSKFMPNGFACLRFFSYGSNMNEGKFREDTRRNGYEFGLENVKKGVLKGYKRILGNKSEKHGLAFTICSSERDQVEGICHDVPIKGLNSFLKKEGLLLDEPSYELVIVSVSDQNNPVLTLKGLKPSSLEKLDSGGKLKVYCYVSTTIEGAERWNVDYQDILEIKKALEKKFCR